MEWFIRYVCIVVCLWIATVLIGLIGEIYQHVTDRDVDIDLLGAISIVVGFVVGILLAEYVRAICT